MYDSFTKEEFNEWVKTNDFFFPTDDNTQESLHLVEELTSYVPNELRIILELKKANPKDDLHVILQKYTFMRKKEMLGQHRLWEQQLQDLGRKHARETVVAMMLRIKSNIPRLNLQLMYLDDKEIPRPITKLANRVLIDYWETSIDSEFTDTINKIFCGGTAEFNPAVKGWAAELYFVYCLKKQGVTAQFRLTLYLVDFSTEDSWKTSWTKTNITASNIQLRFFDGYYPKTDAIDWSSSTIFIPTNNNYPNIDLLFWDHIDQILYPMQITVTNPISKHGDSLEDFQEKSFKGQKQKKLQGWSTCSAGLVKTDGTNTKYLWIGRNHLF